MSYRGYAGSGGSPSEAALFSDALEIFDWLAERTDDIVVHGESLGTGVATYVAAERPARALVLEAPFTAALDIAAATYPWVPVALLMRDPFLSREHIRASRSRCSSCTARPTGRSRSSTAGGSSRRRASRRSSSSSRAPAHSDLWDRGLWPVVLDFLKTERRRSAQAEPVVRRMPSLAG